MSAVPVADPQLAAAKKRQLLAGDVPSPTNPPPACRFHTRCWKAQEHLPHQDAAAGGQGGRQHRRLPLPADGRRSASSGSRPPRAASSVSRRRALAVAGGAARPRRGGRGARAARLRAHRAGGRGGGRRRGGGDREVAGVPLRRRRGARARVRRRTAPTRRGSRRSSARRWRGRTPTSCARRPASRSAACRRSGIRRRCGRWSTRTCSRYDVVWAAAGTPHARLPDRAGASCARLAGGRVRQRSPRPLAEPRERAVPARADVRHPRDRLARAAPG